MFLSSLLFFPTKATYLINGFSIASFRVHAIHMWERFKSRFLEGKYQVKWGDTHRNSLDQAWARLFRKLVEVQKNIREGDTLLNVYEKIGHLEDEIFAVYENRGKTYYSTMKFYLLELAKGLVMKQLKN